MAGRALVRALMALVLGRQLDVGGRENIPRRGALIIAANHAGTVDPALLGALVPRRDLHFMAKREHFRGPRSLFFRAARAFPIVRGGIDLGHDLGMEVVAKGVEDVVTRDLLVRLGCDVGQGHFFARPLAAAALGATLGVTALR